MIWMEIVYVNTHLLHSRQYLWSMVSFTARWDPSSVCGIFRKSFWWLWFSFGAVKLMWWGSDLNSYRRWCGGWSAAGVSSPWLVCSWWPLSLSPLDSVWTLQCGLYFQYTVLSLTKVGFEPGNSCKFKPRNFSCTCLGHGNRFYSQLYFSSAKFCKDLSNWCACISPTASISAVF